MSREIEIKIQINTEELEPLLKWLDSNSKFKGEIHHIEHYINNPKQSFLVKREGIVDAADYLRVRFTEKGDSVCLKRFKYNEDKKSYENIDEIEYKVSSGDEALKLFESIGFSEATIVDKIRRSYDYNKLEIVIDEVKDLGLFVEVELKEEIEGDIKMGYEKIYDLLRKIGFTEIRIQMRGYVSMLWNKDKDFTKLKKL